MTPKIQWLCLHQGACYPTPLCKKDLLLPAMAGAGSAGGQEEANPAFRLATQVGKMGLYYMAGLRVGKMKRILCSDWLPEQARWAHLARLRLPALVPRTKDCLELAYVVL